jgi:hypothetical protein
MTQPRTARSRRARTSGLCDVPDFGTFVADMCGGLTDRYVELIMSGNAQQISTQPGSARASWFTNLTRRSSPELRLMSSLRMRPARASAHSATNWRNGPQKLSGSTCNARGTISGSRDRGVQNSPTRRNRFDGQRPSASLTSSSTARSTFSIRRTGSELRAPARDRPHGRQHEARESLNETVKLALSEAMECRRRDPKFQARVQSIIEQDRERLAK